jgi:ABC-type glycerol-3-phosphate transport system substrate-binding protein
MDAEWRDDVQMKSKWSRGGWLAAVVVLLLAVTTACGGPKADVSVFIMFPQNSPFNKQDELKNALQAKMGEAPTVAVSISPMFELQKMVVELAAGDHGIFVLPKEQFDGFKKEGGFVPLDDILKKEDFPDGVYDGKLIGVPLKDSKLLKDAGYKGGEVFAFITVRVKDKEKAKQVLKVMAEK